VETPESWHTMFLIFGGVNKSEKSNSFSQKLFLKCIMPVYYIKNSVNTGKRKNACSYQQIMAFKCLIFGWDGRALLIKKTLGV